MKTVMKSRAAILAAFSLLFSIIPMAALATVQIPPPPGMGNSLPPPPITQASDVTYTLCALIAWVFWLLIILAVVMFLVGGYRYVTSSGDAERIRSANKTLLYAAIAVVVALVAAGVPYLVSSFIGGGLNGQFCVII